MSLDRVIRRQSGLLCISFQGGRRKHFDSRCAGCADKFLQFILSGRFNDEHVTQLITHMENTIDTEYIHPETTSSVCTPITNIVDDDEKYELLYDRLVHINGYIGTFHWICTKPVPTKREKMSEIAQWIKTVDKTMKLKATIAKAKATTVKAQEIAERENVKNAARVMWSIISADHSPIERIWGLLKKIVP